MRSLGRSAERWWASFRHGWLAGGNLEEIRQWMPRWEVDALEKGCVEKGCDKMIICGRRSGLELCTATRTAGSVRPRTGTQSCGWDGLQSK